MAQAQADWIVKMEPWRGLGYRAPALGRWLARSAREQVVWAARGGRGASAEIRGVIVVERPFLLGGFISLLVVRPAAAGQGVGRALVEHVERQIFVEERKRWLYVSTDAGNRAALGFYRALRFVRVGRLPDLIREGRTEILLRKAPTAHVAPHR